MNLTIYKVMKGTFTYNLVYGNDVTVKESKDMWPCSICRHCTSRNCNMFQISNDTRFHRVCNDCLLEAGDFIDFCFGAGTTALCKKL